MEKDKDVKDGSETLKKPIKVAGILSDLLLSGTNKTALMMVGAVFLIMLVIILFISIVPINQMFSNGTQENDINGIIGSRFASSIGKSNSNVSSKISAKYNCGTLSIESRGNNSYMFRSDTCEVLVTYKPNASSTATNINAYTTAVDGTIAQYASIDTEKAEGLEMPESAISNIEQNENIISIELNSVGKELVLKDGYSSSNSDEYLKEIGAYSSKFYYADPEIDRWDFIKEWEYRWTEIIYDGCEVPRKPYSAKQYYSASTCPKEYRKEHTVEHVKKLAEIEIPVYYNLLPYKEDVINETVNSMVGQTRYMNVMQTDGTDLYVPIEMDQVMARSLFMETVSQNYYSFFQNYGREDNRTFLFNKLISTGYIYDIPIWGVDINDIENIQNLLDSGVTSSVDVSINGNSKELWKLIVSLADNGTISRNPVNYQCTQFAAYWLYVLYGDSFGVHGDGKNMATYLANESTAFNLSKTPSAGGLFSITNDGHGHVGCIDAVDYENKTITISEGNVGAKSVRGTINTGIRLKSVYTFEQWANKVRNDCGSSAYCNVVYAVPSR